MNPSKITRYTKEFNEFSRKATIETYKVDNIPVSQGGRGRGATIEESANHYAKAAYYQSKANEALLLALREEYLGRT